MTYDQPIVDAALIALVPLSVLLIVFLSRNETTRAERDMARGLTDDDECE